jgi:DnaJ-class molecular chaperone
MREGVETEILICPICEGTGTKSWEVLVDPHKGDYESKQDLCPNCKGQGRMKKTVTTIIETVPYYNPEVKNLLFNKLKDK